MRRRSRESSRSTSASGTTRSVNPAVWTSIVARQQRHNSEPHVAIADPPSHRARLPRVDSIESPVFPLGLPPLAERALHHRRESRQSASATMSIGTGRQRCSLNEAAIAGHGERDPVQCEQQPMQFDFDAAVVLGKAQAPGRSPRRGRRRHARSRRASAGQARRRSAGRSGRLMLAVPRSTLDSHCWLRPSRSARRACESRALARSTLTR